MPFPRIRFTMRGLMIAVGIVAFCLFLYRTLSPALIPIGVVGIFIAGFWHHCGRFHPKCAIWGFWSSAVATNLFVAATDIYALCLGGYLLMFLAAYCGITFTLGLGSAWAVGLVAKYPKSRRPAFLGLGVVLALSIAPTTMVMDSWPLKLACLVSRPSMNRLADRVSRGEAIAWPVDAGLFTFVGSDINRETGSVGLITYPDPAGRSGFVRHLPETPADKRLGPFWNLNFNVSMGGGWWYQDED
ncbi:hypothetical protein P12x_004964 [Tundrisphaera lichenicola]|uniref:hypothetical protein n=1 Tax=Tundrisphaera lichenicola TaxID=2029860 RepID=UPI003EBCA4FA